MVLTPRVERGFRNLKLLFQLFLKLFLSRSCYDRKWVNSKNARKLKYCKQCFIENNNNNNNNNNNFLNDTIFGNFLSLFPLKLHYVVVRGRRKWKVKFGIKRNLFMEEIILYFCFFCTKSISLDISIFEPSYLSYLWQTSVFFLTNSYLLWK